jgi:hypothetical protein
MAPRRAVPRQAVGASGRIRQKSDERARIRRGEQRPIAPRWLPLGLERQRRCLLAAAAVPGRGGRLKLIGTTGLGQVLAAHTQAHVRRQVGHPGPQPQHEKKQDSDRRTHAWLR